MKKNLGVAPSGTTDTATKAYVDANANPGTDITALPVLTGLQTATSDKFMVLDISDTTDGVGGTLKNMTRTELLLMIETDQLGVGIAINQMITF